MKAFPLHSAEPILLPDEEFPPKVSILTRLKHAMIAEGTLIAGNLKVFLAAMTILAASATEIAREQRPIEEWGITGVLVAAVLYLVRELAKRETRIEKLWERLAKREKDRDDDEQNGHPRRHTRP